MQMIIINVIGFDFVFTRHARRGIQFQGLLSWMSRLKLCYPLTSLRKQFHSLTVIYPPQTANQQMLKA